jgi:hypothetical protein
MNGASVDGQGQTQYPQTKLNKIRVYKHRGMFLAGDIRSFKHINPRALPTQKKMGNMEP